MSEQNQATQVIEYSVKSIAVIGDTKNIKDELKKLGGRWNPNLKDKNNQPMKGWIFSKKKLPEVEKLLNISDKEVIPEVPKKIPITVPIPIPITVPIDEEKTDFTQEIQELKRLLAQKDKRESELIAENEELKKLNEKLMTEKFEYDPVEITEEVKEKVTPEKFTGNSIVFFEDNSIQILENTPANSSDIESWLGSYCDKKDISFPETWQEYVGEVTVVHSKVSKEEQEEQEEIIPEEIIPDEVTPEDITEKVIPKVPEDIPEDIIEELIPDEILEEEISDLFKLTNKQLKRKATELEIPGRSKLKNKKALIEAICKHMEEYA